MSANPPLRLLAIDPGLAQVGIAIVNVTAMHQLEIDRDWTVRTLPRFDFLDRLDRVVTDVVRAVEATEDGHASWWAVVEDPRGVVQSDAAGRRKDPRHIADLVAAFGAIVMAVKDAGRCEDMTLAPVVQWYPRSGRALMAKPAVLTGIRRRYPELEQASEHVCMAVGLADWWSAKVAPLIWYELGRQPAEAP